MKLQRNCVDLNYTRDPIEIISAFEDYTGIFHS
jgi:hypothetical protein